ncbi:hypothetical protein LUZ60_011587 [Juncus effusus]|nr:hypothetical protein LUZ60_011587 [Juncus effusus]
MNPQIGFLPIDLVIQILARLPPKSLLRFKSVCKSWYHIISSNHFIQLQFHFSSQIPQLVIQSEPNSKNLFQIDPFTNYSNLSLDFINDCVKIRASSNGILCCSSVKNKGVYYICNPITKQFSVLPKTRDRPFTRTQPFYEETLSGLAFNPISFEFTIVLAGFHRSFGRFHRNQFISNVFNSERYSWKRFQFPLFEEFTHMNQNQVVHTTCSINWLTQNCTCLLSFNFEKEIWGKISLPDEILASQNGNRVYLLEFEGLVSVIRISQGVMSTFVLKDFDQEKWELLDRVNLKCIGGFANSGLPIGQNHCFVFMAAQQKVIVYNRKNRIWKEVFSGLRSMYPLWFSAFPFKSSFFPCNL